MTAVTPESLLLPRKAKTDFERWRDELLMMNLEIAVPTWQDIYRPLQDDGALIDKRRRVCVQAIAEHGDVLLYGREGCADVFNRLAEGLAILSFVEGGVSFNGRRWFGTRRLYVEWVNICLAMNDEWVRADLEELHQEGLW